MPCPTCRSARGVPSALGGLAGPEAEGALLRLPSQACRSQALLTHPEAVGARTLEGQHGLSAMAQPSRCTEVIMCVGRVPRPRRGAGLSWAGPPSIKDARMGWALCWPVPSSLLSPCCAEHSSSSPPPPSPPLPAQAGTLPAQQTRLHLECLLICSGGGLWELLLDPLSQPGPRSTMLAQAPSGLHVPFPPPGGLSTGPS